MIAITSTTDRAYLPPACCQLVSVAEHLPRRDDIRMFLVCCDVDDADVAEAQRFFAARHLDVEVIVAQEIAESVQVLDTRWPRAAYLRLHFDSLFGAEFERLVYFDADTRVMASLQPLLDVDLRGQPAGAVHDFIYYVTGNIRRRRRDLFLGHDGPYLQSGVMVFDWPLALASGVLERARAFLDEHPDRCYEAPDQDALNAALVDRWTPLDPRWNLHELYLTFGGEMEPYLQHFTSTKPWSSKRPAAWRNAAAWYEEELAGTAWEGFVAPQRLRDRVLAKLRFAQFRHEPKVRKVLAERAPFLLPVLGMPRTLGDDDVLPWAPPDARMVEHMAAALVDEARSGTLRLRPPESALAGTFDVP